LVGAQVGVVPSHFGIELMVDRLAKVESKRSRLAEPQRGHFAFSFIL
jgi:hypothetical protein